MLAVLGLLLFITIRVNGDFFSDVDNARMPRLFHLDDHDRCLLQKDGLYCLGVFELAPIGPSPVYGKIKEYSSNPFTFNRSRLHRGYCVSARCPSTERNATLRFERCVDERARRHALSARLQTFHYCTTQEQHKASTEQPLDSSQRLFVQVVCAILVLNLVGTVYDVATGDSGKKISTLTVWSIRASWRRLTATYDDGDPRLKNLEPIQGIRVVAMMITIFGHACIQHYQFYVTNPNFLEYLIYRTEGVILANGTSLIQMFVMISSFLTAYNLLLYAETHKLSLLMLPFLVIKRIIRIAPVHLLLVGFAATWWPHTRSGALSAIIGENSAICRRKFWTHVFFVNNIVDKHNRCLPPTWFLPVDMHLFIVACVLTIVMLPRRSRVYRLYGTLFIISTLFCGVVSYVTEWRSFIYFSVPEKLRGVLDTEDSFGGFYASSWGALPACFAGVLMAHLHYDLQERKYNCNENQWLKRMHYWAIPAKIAYVIVTGSILRHYRHPIVSAVHVALDRPIFCLITFFMLFGGINIDGPIRRFFGWTGWRVAARLSLPIMLCHWLILVTICARPAAYHTSDFDIFVDYVATMFLTHLSVVPIALLVEIPVQRFFSQFV